MIHVTSGRGRAEKGVNASSGALSGIGVVCAVYARTEEPPIATSLTYTAAN